LSKKWAGWYVPKWNALPIARIALCDIINSLMSGLGLAWVSVPTCRLLLNKQLRKICRWF